MVAHDVRWLAPAPLWPGATVEVALAGDAFKQPAILRFDNDGFMEELMALLDAEPERLQSWVAKAETWREPMSKLVLDGAPPAVPQLLALLHRTRGLGAVTKTVAGRQATAFANAAAMQLKLYQPAQQRFYLVGATLVCKTPGLPDRVIDGGRKETASFVLRQVSANREYAFVGKGQSFEWQAIEQGKEATLKDNEECLPLFNLNYRQTPDRKRRLLAGLIPVSRREAYLGAPLGGSGEDGGASGETEYGPLRLLLQSQIVAPWKALLQQLELQKLALNDAGFVFLEQDALKQNKVKAGIVKTARETSQTVSWYILLELADFLQVHTPNVWQKIATGNANLSAQETALYQFLASLQLPPAFDAQLKQEIVFAAGGVIAEQPPGTIKYQALQGVTVVSALPEALKLAAADRNKLETADHPYARTQAIDSAWPAFLFPLADPVQALFSSGQVDQLVEKMAPLLTESSVQSPDLQPVKIRPADGNARFVIRCVFEQPQCEPIRPPVLSEPSQDFEMAAFFDPDAPARPVRIPMPMDISPAGLRKYQKNTSLVISDMLCGKLEKIKQLSLGDLVLSVLPWPFHRDLPDVNDTGPCKQGSDANFGMICSLSIPIVTLVALILMIIMVALFDMIFKWIPYLFMCLPIPGLKGKNG